VTDEGSGTITADRLGILYILPDFLTNLLKFGSKSNVSDRFPNQSQKSLVFRDERERLENKTGIVRS
jgi:hypothetical protein